MSGRQKLAALIVLIISFFSGLGVINPDLTSPTLQHALTVMSVPSDGGSITPDGGKYIPGETISLTINPAFGYRFDHWSGDATGTSHHITITMDADKELTAHFIVSPPPKPTTTQPSMTKLSNTKIAFVSGQVNNEEIYVMNADGSNLTRLTKNNTRDLKPFWSPDGTKISFTSNRDGNYKNYVMKADGTDQVQWTPKDYGYGVSPDGSRRAFVSNQDGNMEICVMNADGSRWTRLTNNSARDEQPVWSPDGSKIAFNSDRDGNWEIYVINADGSGEKRLTRNDGDDFVAAWTPDGSRIVFTSYRDRNARVYIMNADGSRQTRLTGIRCPRCGVVA